MEKSKIKQKKIKMKIKEISKFINKTHKIYKIKYTNKELE